MNQKFTSTIAGASIFISLVGLISRGFGFLREMLFASYFGLGTDFDIYLVSAVLPITLNTVLLYISQNFFVPALQKINPEQSQKYYNQAFGIFILAGFFLTLILFSFSDIIINLYIPSESIEIRESALLIFRLFLVTIPFSAGISMLSALLQTVFEFKYPSISILFLNVSIIILILLFTSRIGIYVIPAGYIIGTIIQFFYLLYKSNNYFQLRIKLITSFHQYNFFNSLVGRSILIIIMIELIGQFYSIFDRYFYSDIMQGGIASLNYAYIIYVLPITIFSVSLATAIFPKITKAIVNSSKNDLERFYSESISINILIFMPITFLLFYFGETIIKVAFQRGKFLGESTTITYNALKCYSVSLIFYSIYSVLNKMFYSMNLSKLLLIVTIIGILLKLIFNFLLVEQYQQYGLALSTSISFIFFFVVSYLVINTKLKITDKTIFIKEFCFYFINCCICFMVIYIPMSLLSVKTIYTEFGMIGIFIAVYLMNLVLLKHKYILLLKQVIQRIKNGGSAKSI
jgi:putative peptidoglycan lipid II flippase